MKEAELRVGNLIHDTFEKKNREWTLSSFRSLSDRTIKMEEIIPIPLTWEFLIDTGHQEKYPMFIKGDFMVRFDNEIDVYFFGQLLRSVKYVHEYQNLYYSIENKELVLAVTPNEVQK